MIIIKQKYKYLAFGITNQCHDKTFIPFFDYDITNLFTISKELRGIQEKFNLSNFYIIESFNGFNVFSLDKISFNRLKTILNYTKFVDRLFIKCSIQRGFCTLRMGNDKKYLTILENAETKYKKSLVHKKFFIEIMKYPITDNLNFDNNQMITITCFGTNNHGFPMEMFKFE